MAKILITILGKGQQELKLTEYRQANYFLGDKKNSKTTPFVGEAIVHLIPPKETFDIIYILGTNDSMWHTLYAHCSLEMDRLGEDVEQQFQQIHSEIKNREITENTLQIVAQVFKELIRIETKCQIIDIGRTEEELWRVFEVIANIPNKKDIVSIDITHGLRYQPLFLFLALSYFKNIKNISIKDVFYGGIELQQDFKENGKELAPIFNLKPMVDILAWVDAATVFHRYGDISLFTQLLKEQRISEQFIKEAENYATILQLNDVTGVRAASTKFINQLEKISTEGKIKPLEFTKDLMREFPEKINEKTTDWQFMLLMAERYYNTKQLTMCIMVLYEAIISRIAKVYKNANCTIDESSMEDYSRCSKIAKDRTIIAIYNDVNGLQDFPIKVKELADIRNSLAHVRENDQVSKTEIPAKFEALYKYFKNRITSSKLDELPNHKTI